MDAKLLMMAASGVGGGDFYPYTVDNSCRFNDNDSAYLYRTPSSGGSQDATTISVWVKRGNLGIYSSIFWQGNASDGNHNNSTYAYWNTDNSIQFKSETSGSVVGAVETTPLYRDPSGWYHLVFVYDSANGTTNDRMRIYVNGERVTALDTNTMPSQDADSQFNKTDRVLRLGGAAGSTPSSYFADCYFSQFVFIDGTVYTASDFGEDKNGVWVPKSVSGLTFGTNGFYLDFADSSALGNDVSGNNNDFTSSGLAASDQMTDTPTNNFATYNPLSNYPPTGVLGNGNLQLQGAADNSYTGGVSTLGIAPDTGIYYAEYLMTIDNRNAFGITSWISSHASGSGNDQTTYGYYLFAASSTGTSTIYELAVSSQTGLTDITAGDIVGIVYDSDNLTLDFYINNAQVGTTVSVPSQTYQFFGDGYGVSPQVLNKANFGQDSSFGGSKTAQNNPDTNDIGDFYYTRASVEGAKALCTANLPEPTIGPNSATLPSEVFATVLYTGNGTAIGSGGKAVTGVGFQPDMVWIKNRDAADQWMVFDSVRGVTKYLSTDDSGTEVTDTESLSTFDADGFTLGNNVAVNTNTEDYVAYCFKITAGFFDVVTYEGTGSAHTESHSLTSVPDLIFVKDIDNVRGWIAYVSSLPVSDPETDYLLPDLTSAVADAATVWNDTAPTDSVFSVGTSNNVNASSQTYIAYLFADMEGLCKVGYYEGNGNADGPFEYLGFSPEFHMKKSSSYAGTFWLISDTARNPNNVVGEYLAADGAGAEVTYAYVDHLSNGEKNRNTGDSLNRTSADYITLSIGGNSIKYSNAR